MMNPKRITVDEILCYFSELEDPRDDINQKHPFASVLVIALMAILAGAAGPTAIARARSPRGPLLYSDAGCQGFARHRIVDGFEDDGRGGVAVRSWWERGYGETLLQKQSGTGRENLARAVRGHWGVENGGHWILDVIYREDESRIREQNVRENFAWLNRFTLTLLKQHPGKSSVAMKRRNCGWNDEFLMQVLTGK
jgi:predicted transposase YbfD/YdcC